MRAWIKSVLGVLLPTFILAFVFPIAAPLQAHAADANNFNPGKIITDELFYDSRAMSAEDIQHFLNEQGKACTKNCLKDLKLNTQNKEPTARCKEYKGKEQESAAEIIANVATACGISPKVILVTLQKETSLVTLNAPAKWRYERAMGYYCPDDPSRPGWCHPDFGGFFNQVYNAASQIIRYRQQPEDFGYRAGRINVIKYHPNAACGTTEVFIENDATAALYIYTPYVPNQSALSNLYGLGDECSSYGNRNFWRLYTDWFGSTGTGASAGTPVGQFEFARPSSRSIFVQGWAKDPDWDKETTLVWISVDGKGKYLEANIARRDSTGALINTGFEGEFPVTPGRHEVCATVHNRGKGMHKFLGCKSVFVGSVRHINSLPSGAFEINPSTKTDEEGGKSAKSSSGRDYVISGWIKDRDAANFTQAIVYVNSAPYAVFDATNRRKDGSYAFAYTLHVNATLPRLLQVCVSAVDAVVDSETSGAISNVKLGCREIKIDSDISPPKSSDISPPKSYDKNIEF